MLGFRRPSEKAGVGPLSWPLGGGLKTVPINSLLLLFLYPFAEFGHVRQVAM